MPIQPPIKIEVTAADIAAWPKDGCKSIKTAMSRLPGVIVATLFVTPEIISFKTVEGGEQQYGLPEEAAYWMWGCDINRQPITFTLE